jgi:hypothetical protein
MPLYAMDELALTGSLGGIVFLCCSRPEAALAK